MLHRGHLEAQSPYLQQSEAMAAQGREGRRRLAPFNDGTVRVFHDVIESPLTPRTRCTLDRPRLLAQVCVASPRMLIRTLTGILMLFNAICLLHYTILRFPWASANRICSMGYAAFARTARLVVSARLLLPEVAGSILRRCNYFARRFPLSACDRSRLNGLRLTIGAF